MARVIPFRGIFYNQENISNLKEVVTPPYDVISEQQQQEYYMMHPQNVIRLVLGKEYPDDNEHSNRYTRAGEFFRIWLDQGILKQDAGPALYATEIDFVAKGMVHTRFGFIGLVELEDFEKGGIFPHEKTFTATKADRLRLMEACKANFNPVFSLFSDRHGQIVGPLRASIKGREPDLEFDDLEGCRHRLWRVKDQKIHTEVSERLSHKPLFIADGHHRYETALAYRNQVMSNAGEFDRDDPCNFIMMYLSSLHDPGLTIRPVHRMICDVPAQAMEGFEGKARSYFDVEALEFESLNRVEVEETFLAKVSEGAERGVIGAVLQDHRAFYVLRVRNGIMDRLFEREIPAPLRRLDVNIATKLVLQQILGFDHAALDDEQRILYASRAEKALEAVNTGKCAISLILNSTRLAHLEEVSKAGLILPRKSTYFYPKVMSGLVTNKIGD